MPAPRPPKSSPQDAKPKPAPVAKPPTLKPVAKAPAPKPVAKAPSGPESKPSAPARPAPKPVFVSTPAADNKPAPPAKPVATPVFKDTLPPASVAVAAPAGGGGQEWLVTASAEVMGGTGSCGHAIVSDGYSELSTDPTRALDFSALGDLPCGLELVITNPANGHSVTTAKQDVGAGSSFLPVMGLYPDTRSKLGLSGGQFSVLIRRKDGIVLHPARGKLQGGVTTPAKPAMLLYANPLKDANVTAKRIDQGVDYAGTGHYSAIAAGVVTTVWTPAPGWPGNMIQYKITQKGALEGVFVYYAEGIKTDRTAGDTFKAGDWLCSLIPNWPTATEIGFASSPGDDATWAEVFGGGYNEGDLTRAGIAMSNLIHRLGGPAGLEEGRTPVGDWPPWFKNGVIPADLATASGPAQQSAGVTAVQHPSAKVGAKDYSWPATQLEAWTALDKGTVDAVVRSKAARDYAAGITFVKATEDGS